jgi:hypothetical protein
VVLWNVCDWICSDAARKKWPVALLDVPVLVVANKGWCVVLAVETLNLHRATFRNALRDERHLVSSKNGSYRVDACHADFKGDKITMNTHKSASQQNKNLLHARKINNHIYNVLYFTPTKIR